MFKAAIKGSPALERTPSSSLRSGMPAWSSLASLDPSKRQTETPSRHDFSRASVYPPTRAPQDIGEQEAGRAAAAVMRVGNGEAASPPSLTPLHADVSLQRLCAGCDEEARDGSNGKGAATGNEDAQGASDIEGHAGSEVKALESSGGGSPLPRQIRSFFEPRFGHDFSAVRIHTGSRAAQLARSVDARAFAHGRDIVFGAGEYSPSTEEGRHVLAHELAHVVQQRQTAPLLQRLSITQQKLTKGTCGQRNVQWIFSLDKAAPADGYIVQQIEQFELVNACPTPAIGPPAPVEKFWEAWRIKKGDKVDWTTTRDGWTDGSTKPSRPSTNGTQSAFGTLKFFAQSTTGDLGDFGVAPADPASAWGPGKVPTSGALPSTPSQPSWWGNAPVEGPAQRSALGQWNCCDADPAKNTYDLKVQP